MLFSFPGRDDADDFFAMMILSNYVYHQQHRPDSRFNTYCPDGMPALSSGIHPVPSNQTGLVLEYECGQLE
jgi:hypothetical protein